ncbi:hypothetical protein K461DRAFT_277660 [Myriangium duriaei CBS 260.36]|uniref:Uncharacterized protein n=1 Tax=Myriangium duriaei CBS 260.36 TaxID=1168546 RepID=A0A9P4MFW9_9PEZI|nr:hypothetical protein K461DRAFT_277660 [Myriangium duriaei CBS 260.36]
MNPWLSWAIVLGAAGVLYWHYTRNNRAQTGRARSNTGSDGPQLVKSTKKEERAKRKPGLANNSELSGGEASVASAVEKTKPSAAGSATQKRGGNINLSAPLTSAILPAKEPEEDASDRQWAEQLAKARKGTNLTVPSKETGRTRTVKTSGASTSPEFSSDADDDLTPGISPTLQAGDVSDMLEPTQAGPSVLRLTEPTNPAPQRAPRLQKEFQVAETKKQRQNRRKNEERKAANQDLESDRQALLEKQRRTAREARGEPARNGLQQSQPPSSNAWTSKPQTEQTAPKIEGAPAVQPLLDTFDRAEPPAVGNAQASVVPATGTSTHNEYSNGMSEEEQFNLASRISNDSDGWATVATKKGRKQAEGLAPRTFQSSTAPVAPRVTNGFASLPDEE